MAYNKQTWKAGDKITAKKLNHIEEGIAASGNGSGSSSKFVVTFTVDDSGDEPVVSADKSISEIISAYLNGEIIVGKYNQEADIEIPLTFVYHSDELNEGDEVGFVGSPEPEYQISFDGSVRDGNDEWYSDEAELIAYSDTLKKTYTFDFTIDLAQGTAAPANGVTYSAISDACYNTSNVYARLSDNNFNSYYLAKFDDFGVRFTDPFRASLMILSGTNPNVIKYLAINIHPDDSCDLIVQPLANAT